MQFSPGIEQLNRFDDRHSGSSSRRGNRELGCRFDTTAHVQNVVRCLNIGNFKDPHIPLEITTSHGELIFMASDFETDPLI